MANGNGTVQEVQFEELTDDYITRATGEFNNFVAPVATQAPELPEVEDPIVGTLVNPQGWDQATQFDYSTIQSQINDVAEKIAQRALGDIPTGAGGNADSLNDKNAAVTENPAVNNTPAGPNGFRITQIQSDVNNIYLKSGLTPPFPWCAASVTWWWGFGFQDAGKSTVNITNFLPGTGPTTNSDVSSAGNAYVPRWEYWAKETRRFTRLPGVGYAALYKNSLAPYATHIGVVVSVERGTTCTVVCGNDGAAMAGSYTNAALGSSGIRLRKHTGISGFVGFIAPIPLRWNGTAFSPV